MNRFQVGGTALANVTRFRRTEDVDRRRPVLRQARHARQHGEAAVRAAVDADLSGSTQSRSCSHSDGVFPVLHVAATPIALDEPLVRLARSPSTRWMFVASTAMPRESKVLVERLVERLLLRLGPRRESTGRPAPCRRPRGDRARPESHARPKLGIAHRARRRRDRLRTSPPMRLSVTGLASPVAVSTTQASAGRRGVERIRAACEPSGTSARAALHRSGAGREPGGQVRLRKIAPGLEVTKTQAVVKPLSFTSQASTRPSVDAVTSSTSCVGSSTHS